MAGRTKKKSGIDILLTIILIAALGVFAYAAFKLVSFGLEYKKADDEYEKISQMAVTEKDPDAPGERPVVSVPGETQENAPAPAVPFTIDFASLKSINDDVIGWIYMEAIESINYPVVRGSDNSYYLHRTYQGTDNFAGTIFVDYTNKRDFSDCNTIIYGHNMKNGSMFGSLKNYTADPSLMEKSRYFWIFTPEASLRYEIISAYTTAVDGDTYTLFKGPGAEFEAWLQRILSYSQLSYRPEKSLSITDKIVTLSTCTGDQSTRYVVQGRLSDRIS